MSDDDLIAAMAEAITDSLATSLEQQLHFDRSIDIATRVAFDVAKPMIEARLLERLVASLVMSYGTSSKNTAVIRDFLDDANLKLFGETLRQKLGFGDADTPVPASTPAGGDDKLEPMF
jgi:hypothetical protein